MTADSSLVTRQPGSTRNVGPFLNVITWILLITSVLAVLTRLITKRALRRRIDIDDALVVCALAASIGSGISVSVQTSNGLGRDITLLSTSQVQAYQKSEYATKLLYLPTLAFAKLSITSLLMMLTASELHRRIGITLATVIAIWGVISEFAAAFECSAPRSWDYLRVGASCLDKTAFWRATAIINMLTDLALILYPVHVIITLQMSRGKKFTILVFFGARSLDVIATGIQLAYTGAFNSLNPTMDLWKWTLTTQIIQCITVITSCVPYLRPLLEAIPSGMYGADDMRRRGTPSTLGYKRSGCETYKLSNGSSKSPKTEVAPSKRFLSTLSMNSNSGVPDGPRRPDGETLGVQITSERTGSGEGKWETESHGSQAKIFKTTTMSAAWAERDEPGDEIWRKR